MEGIRIPQVGEVIAGKYRLTRLLGEGGMGFVLEAEHMKLRQPIAIKFLSPAMLGTDEIVQRFEREARAAATLRSRHVVRVTDVEVTAEGLPYMVMELLEGSDLESERERRKKLPFGEAVDYVLQACGALAEAHDAGIVHRDLKPGNLFLAREDGDRPIVKVLDFGISKFLKDDDVKLTSAGALMGTALYMSPEQIRGDASIDARSDIWALGVILFELIGGAAPWTGSATRVAAGIVAERAPDLRAIAPSVPEALANAIYRMLEKSPANRFASVMDVAAAIAPFAPPGSVGAEVAEQLARRSQRTLAAAQTSLAPISGNPISAAVDSNPSLPVSAPASANTQHLVMRPNPNPEQRSTTGATTTSAGSKIGRPRAVWGALAAFGTLAIAGVALIVFANRAKPTHDDGTTGVAATLPSPDPGAAPSVTQVVASQMAPTSASAPPSASSASAPTTQATTTPSAVATAVKKPPPSPTPPATSMRTAAPVRTTTAPPKASEPLVNPPFLK